MNKINDEVNKKRDKDMWCLLPYETLQMAVKAFTYGAKKYSPNNWKLLKSEDYFNAMMRHAVEDIKGEKYDESSIPHLGHFLASAIMYTYLRWKEINND
jgi:hypothetical protein